MQIWITEEERQALDYAIICLAEMNFEDEEKEKTLDFLERIIDKYDRTSDKERQKDKKSHKDN